MRRLEPDAKPILPEPPSINKAVLSIQFYENQTQTISRSADTAPAKASQAIPWSQLGAKAGADYQGDGLAVSPTAEGARLRCVFQRLEGEATHEGLWLTFDRYPAKRDGERPFPHRRRGGRAGWGREA